MTWLASRKRRLADRILNAAHVQRRLNQKIGQHENQWPGISLPFHLPEVPAAYSRPAKPEQSERRGEASPVFITARFRSGSSFLWKVLSALDGVSTIYEPFNEDRFTSRYMTSQTDPTHLGISSYRDASHDIDGLSQGFSREWSTNNLLLTERSYMPDMESYLSALIGSLPHRPILQFNRADFRLGWLRQTFPDCTIVHLYRDPRAQWTSIMSRATEREKSFVNWQQLQSGYFYTLQWAHDLKAHFPFLDPDKSTHPYALHYMIWRLSFAFGTHYADISIGYEELTENFDTTMTQILQQTGIDNFDMDELATNIRVSSRQANASFSNSDFLNRLEEECDEVLDRFFQG